jgi:hypothetical protein
MLSQKFRKPGSFPHLLMGHPLPCAARQLLRDDHSTSVNITTPGPCAICALFKHASLAYALYLLLFLLHYLPRRITMQLVAVIPEV